MAATKTVSQLPQSHNSLIPRHGVLTLFGYGIQIRVDRGHLLLEDGIGSDRQQVRLPRVAHGLRRLVVIGSDGMISLAALRWLADQDASFVMLERDGSVLAATGPVSSSDARLHRAQALAYNNELAVRIARELIYQKLQGQERVARHKLNDNRTASSIAMTRSLLAEAETISAIRLIESQAGAAYWSAWHSLPIIFPRNDMQRVPEHWRVFGGRKSPLSGSPRYAVNPPNAILSYLYTVLESEARLAAAAMGLQPELGVMHLDAPHRDSLACDLMEPVRPKVDAYVLDWIQHPLKRNWFFEQRDGNCRLMAPFAVRLAETAATWRREVAPLAEWLAQTLWSTLNRPSYERAPATRLTQQKKRESKGSVNLPFVPALAPDRMCAFCGVRIDKEHKYCVLCSVEASREQLREYAKRGRIAAQTDQAQTSRRATKRRHDVARQGWLPSSIPTWLTTEVYLEKIQPRLTDISNATVSSALGVSLSYSADIRAGRRRPHPRHWQALAKLVGVSNSP